MEGCFEHAAAARRIHRGARAFVERLGDHDSFRVLPAPGESWTQFLLAIPWLYHLAALLSSPPNSYSRLAGAEGFEPSALGFGDRCSDQAELRPYARTEFYPTPPIPP